MLDGAVLEAARLAEAGTPSGVCVYTDDGEWLSSVIPMHMTAAHHGGAVYSILYLLYRTYTWTFAIHMLHRPTG